MVHAHMNITVFGGAQPKPGDPAYQEALRLGSLLAYQGHTVLTGGYIGTMEAVSRGACEAGGHVVGVTCQEIETWRAVSANAWVREERHFNSLRERLFALIDGCDAAMALPGGAGTLAEIAIMWNQMIVDAIPSRPLILVGKAWEQIFAALFDGLGSYVPERDQRRLVFVENIDDAVKALESVERKA